MLWKGIKVDGLGLSIVAASPKEGREAFKKIKAEGLEFNYRRTFGSQEEAEAMATRIRLSTGVKFQVCGKATVAFPS